MSSSLEVASAIVDSLHLAGVKHCVYSPGSRNSPFAYALDAACKRGRIEAHVRIDERSAGFYALGLSLGDSAPVALFMTSGTAVAEVHAAVVEAYHSGVPLIIVSADRPFRMHGVGASQTTPQVGIFGAHVRNCWDVPEGITVGPWLSAGVQRQVAVAKGLVSVGAGVGPGPVQINVQLDVPLVPAAPAKGSASDTNGSIEPLATTAIASTPNIAPRSAQSTAAPSRTPYVNSASSSRTFYVNAAAVGVPWESVVDQSLNTVVLMGSGGQRAAELLGSPKALPHIPVFAEPTVASAWRTNFPFYRTLLGSSYAQTIAQVVVVGRPTLTREVSMLLARNNIRIVVVTGGLPVTDVAGTARVVVDYLAAPLGADPSQCGEVLPNKHSSASALSSQDAASLSGTPVPPHEISSPREFSSPHAASSPGPLPSAREAFWNQTIEAHTKVREAVTQMVEMAGIEPLKELVCGSPIVMLGASNTIRLVDTFGWFARSDTTIISNRGAAGIDGTIATAAGIAKARDEEVTLILGDLTFFHDASSLAFEPGQKPPKLRIVVLDNRGGGIFGTLEPGQEHVADSFTRWFATPQNINIAGIAAAYGCSYREADVASLDTVTDWWNAPRDSGRVTGIHEAASAEALPRHSAPLSDTLHASSTLENAPQHSPLPSYTPQEPPTPENAPRILHVHINGDVTALNAVKKLRL